MGVRYCGLPQTLVESVWKTSAFKSAYWLMPTKAARRGKEAKEADRVGRSSPRNTDVSAESLHTPSFSHTINPLESFSKCRAVTLFLSSIIFSDVYYSIFFRHIGIIRNIGSQKNIGTDERSLSDFYARCE